MNKHKIKLLIIDFLLLMILIAVDQLTKYMAVLKLKNQPAFSIIDGILEFNYLENRGAAFGMLQNQKIFFVFVAVIFLCVIIYVLIRTMLNYSKKRRIKDMSEVVKELERIINQ